MFVPFDDEETPSIPPDTDYTTSLRFEQDMAYKESEELDQIKAMAKAEASFKQAKAEKEARDYEAALQEVKNNIEKVRAKRLLALTTTKL